MVASSSSFCLPLSPSVSLCLLLSPFVSLCLPVSPCRLRLPREAVGVVPQLRDGVGAVAVHEVRRDRGGLPQGWEPNRKGAESKAKPPKWISPDHTDALLVGIGARQTQSKSKSNKQGHAAPPGARRGFHRLFSS